MPRQRHDPGRVGGGGRLCRCWALARAANADRPQDIRSLAVPRACPRVRRHRSPQPATHAVPATERAM